MDFLKKKIIIVGAGMSGLSAALCLRQFGFSNIYILEAQNHIGGRTQTLQIDSQFVEMGAQWIHGQKDNIIYEIANSNGLLNKSAVSYIDLLDRFTFYPKEKDIIVKLIEYLFDKMENISGAEPNSCVFSYLSKHFHSFMTDFSQHPFKDNLYEAFDWFCKFQCEINGCQHLSVLSLNSLSAYKECDGSQTVELNQGYNSILNLFLKNIPNNWILKNHCVTKIDWSELANERTVGCCNYADFSNYLEQLINRKSIRVTCENGKEYFADHVIVTLPLGYLKKHSQSLFYPHLSEKKQEAISCLGFGTVNKVFINFDDPFWDEYSVINVLWCKKFDEHFPDEYSNHHKALLQHWVKGINRFAYTLSHPNMLCAWVVGEEAVILESLPDVKVMDDCMKLLELLFKKKLPNPTKIVRSSWFSDSFTCGSYSYISMACEKRNISHLDLAEPEFFIYQHPVLLFAGEASHQYYFSTVHGACESGIREAERLFQYYRNRDVQDHCDKLVSLTAKITSLLSCKKNIRKNLKILIVGAGIAGLSCASHLVKNNFVDIHILEAQNRIGGRVHSINYGNNFLELGAQWIHGTENELYKFSKAHGILTITSSDLSFEGKGIFCSTSGTLIDSNLVEEVKEVLNQAKAKLENGNPCHKDKKSVLSFFTESFNSYIEKSGNSADIAVKQGLFEWYMKFEVIDNACDSLDTIATQSYADWDDCPTDEYHVNTEKGFYSIIDTLRSTIPNVNISLNKPVETIKWHENFKQKNYSESFFNSRTEDSFPVTLHCEDGESFHADCVVVTSSIGFLKENCKKFFIPSLPINKYNALESIGFGTINKIFLVYNKAFWHPTNLGIQLVWINKLSKESERLQNENPWIRGITGFDVVKKQPHVLLGWIGGKEAKLIETIEDDVIGSVCTELFKIFLNRTDIPNPIKIFRSQWFHNPYVKGSYSNRELSFYECDSSLHDLQCPLLSTYETKQNVKLQWPIIVFAGEAFDSHGFSSAHGAYQSGLEAAKSMIKSCSEIEECEEF